MQQTSLVDGASLVALDVGLLYVYHDHIMIYVYDLSGEKRKHP